MRVAILTDVHGNLPALQAALGRIADLGCKLLFHTGDAIGIGPYPAECLDLLLGRSDTYLTMGNHDAWFAFGLPSPRPAWLSEGEVAHQDWVHAQLDPARRAQVARWPYVLERDCEGVRVAFLHYGLDPTRRNFAPIVAQPTPADLDSLFGGIKADVVFYGHDHRQSDLRGAARYVNPGSLGCSTEALARFCVLDCASGTATVQHCTAPYDPSALFAAFEDRAMPERAFIRRAFFGRT